MKLEITKTRYNLGAILGWVGLVLGLVGVMLQQEQPTTIGFYATIMVLLASGIAVNVAGPLKTVSKHKIQVGDLRKKG